MSDYETAGGRSGAPERLYPASWGRPAGARFSAERRDWVMRNVTRNPRFKLEQMRQAERRDLRAEIAAIDDKLRALGITPPKDDFQW